MFRCKWIGLSLVILLASMPILAQEPTPQASGTPEIEKQIGKRCAIHLKQKQPDTKVQATGKILRVDKKSVVLGEAHRIVRKQHPVPIVGRFSMLKSLFKNVSIGRQAVSGELVIPRESIAKVNFEPAKKTR